jgi:hypothetical protein
MRRPVPAVVVALHLLAAARALPLAAQELVNVARPAAGDAAIRIFSPAGSLRITSWARDSVTVSGRVDAGIGRFGIGGTRSALKLGLDWGPAGAGDGTADLDIRVPAGARLWVKSAPADHEKTPRRGTVEVINVGGRIRVSGRATSVSAEALDGNIELALESEVGRVRTASGTIVVRGVIRDLDASTVSGPLLVGMEDAVARARLETVSSEIAFKGDLVADGKLVAETHGGDVELRLPARLGASFHLVSYGGGLVNELVPPQAVRTGPGKGEWTFRTGDGRAGVEVRTFKGRVTLKVRSGL